MKFVCVTVWYECGSNPDGSTMICTETNCYLASDDHDPFTPSYLLPAKRRSKSTMDTVGEMVKMLRGLGFEVSNFDQNAEKRVQEYLAKASVGHQYLSE